MVIAVSEAGGLGSLPSAQYSAEQLRAALDTIRAGTKKPINVNFFRPHCARKRSRATNGVASAACAYYVEGGA